MKEFLKQHKYVILLTTLSIVVYFRLFSFDIFSSSDWTFAFHDTLRDMMDFTTWTSYSTGGVNALLWRLFWPNSVLFGLFWYLSLDSNVADKFLIMWVWILLSAFSGYALVKEVTKSEIGAFVGGLVMAFNTYFLSIDTQGHLLLSTASIFGTFALLFFIKSLDRKRTDFGFLTTIFLFLSWVNDLRILYITIWILFFYALYFVFFMEGLILSDYKKSLKTILIAFLPVGVLLLLNSFWILPSFFTGSLGDNDILGRSLFGNEFLDITKTLTLFHPFWIHGNIDWFIAQPIPLYFWAIPILAFSGLMLNRADKKIVFFGLISLLWIFLAKQVGQPFQWFYEWMYLHFPGFNAFREATKFYYIIVLWYSMLIGSFVSYVSKNMTQRILKTAIITAISGLFLYNTLPILSGSIGNLFIQKEIPADYMVFRNFVLKQDGFFRVFWVPRSTRWWVYTDEKPSISSINVLTGEWKGVFPRNNSMYQSEEDTIMKVFNTPFSDTIFDETSIKYVAVPLEDTKNGDDFFVFYGWAHNSDIHNWYIHKLDGISWLKKIDIGTKNLVVYENKNYKDHIYTQDKQEDPYMNIDSHSVDWTSVDSTKYTIHLNHIRWLTYLHFTDKFHPEWKLFGWPFHWFDIFGLKAPQSIDIIHTKSNTNTNVFTLDVESIKKDFPKTYFTQNTDGSIDMDLTLYFWPQSYFYLWLIVSLFTLLASSFYLIQFYIKKRSGIESSQ